MSCVVCWAIQVVLSEDAQNVFHLVDGLHPVLVCEEAHPHCWSSRNVVISKCFEIGEISFKFLVARMFGMARVG